MAQEVARQRLGVRRHVEGFVCRDAAVRAGRDVADGVAAGLARREPGFGQPAHGRLDVVQLQEVELHVLAGGDVAEAARVRGGHVGQRVELLAVQDALRDLDAQHLGVVCLALAVGAAHQPEGAPLVGGDLAALEPVQRAHELVDLRLVREGQPGTAEGGDIVDGCHD